jgi:predicted pyridoxine 5'-phosphate oxidase superfamily flavin-nucleotide-binding protein
MARMLSDEVLAYIDRSVLCWLATVDATGAPNVSPKQLFAASDRQTLVIAALASPGTVDNLARSPQVCVSFIEVFIQKGFKLRGTAEVFALGSAPYEQLVGPLRAMTQGQFLIPAVIAVRVSAVEPIVAPGYSLKPGATEDSQIAEAMRDYYGVTPAP